jgi:uncharacterized protein (TIGR02284 family)
MNRDDVISTLNDLIQISEEGEIGFGACAEHVKNPTLRAFFERNAERCRDGSAQLQAIVREMGGDPRRGGPMSRTMRRFWADLVETISAMDDHTILDECERGEGAARQAYQDALKQDLPGDIRRLIERQYREVRANHDRVREMRNLAA